MSQSLSRRGFFRALGGRKNAAPPLSAPLRPPWALPEAAFASRCTRCLACLAACPSRIICQDAAGLPQIDFSAGECTFCAACVSACAPAALERLVDSTDEASGDERAAPPWAARAEFGSRCLLLQRVDCRVCGEACPEAAISFQPQPGGSVELRFAAAACSGCGACFAPCPAAAISIVAAPPDGQASALRPNSALA